MFEKKVKCPLIQKECMGAHCAWWTKVDMFEPVTKKLYSEEKCAVLSIGPMLVELIGKTNSVGQAVESSRNETIKRQDALLSFGRLLNGSR